MGGVDAKGVEALAKVYVWACKRPEPPAPPERRYGNEEPPTYKAQHKDTYHYSQYRRTPADYAMRKRIEERDKRLREESDAIYETSVKAHREAYPTCANRYCPYCRLDSDDLQL